MNTTYKTCGKICVWGANTDPRQLDSTVLHPLNQSVPASLRDAQPKTRVLLSKTSTTNSLWALPKLPLWEAAIVGTSWSSTKCSDPLCQPRTVTVSLEACMRCKPMSSALWALGATTKHLLMLPVLALKSHTPTPRPPRNQETTGESCQSHIHVQTD